MIDGIYFCYECGCVNYSWYLFDVMGINFFGDFGVDIIILCSEFVFIC